MLMPVAAVCFIGALLTDITYAASAEMMWANFSAWFLAVGMIFGVAAFIAGLVAFLGNRVVRAQPGVWPYLIGNLAVLVLAFFNNLIHTRDAWTSVMPIGLILSIITVLMIAVTGWVGSTMVVRRDAGVMR
jgi:uncharacterized membrane protein